MKRYAYIHGLGFRFHTFKLEALVAKDSTAHETMIGAVALQGSNAREGNKGVPKHPELQQLLADAIPKSLQQYPTRN
jgi:hypothetical protein